MSYWHLPQPVEIFEDIRAAHREVPLPVLRALVRRGVDTAQAIETYLHPHYARDLHDPFLFRDMEKVVQRLAQAAEGRERVMIHGDYDADGVTASAILSMLLEMLGVAHEVFLPHRERDGYGLGEEAVARAQQRGITLLITADCGIASISPIAQARSHGIDVIVVDHHQRKEELPAAVAIIHPSVDEGYPDKTLTGGAAAFKIVQAIVRTGHPVIVERRAAYAARQPQDFRWEGFEKWMLDLVAVSTVADCTLLVGESRALVYWGLKVLARLRRPGIRALMNNTRVGVMNARTIAFAIAPRLNAPGRLEHANLALELLLEQDEEKAGELAQQIEQLNIRRQELTEVATKEAIAAVGLEPHSSIVVCRKEWPLGIVGIVAARLCDAFNRPAFVMTQAEGKIVGSARAPHGHNVLALLERSHEFLARYGGHPQAGGFTVHSEDHIEGFRASVESAGVNGGDVLPSEDGAGVRADDEINLADVTDDLAEWVGKCEPFGQGNPPIGFSTTDCELVGVRTFKDGKHVECMVRQNGQTRRMVGFGMGERARLLRTGAVVDVLFEVRMGEYQGERSVECILKDIKEVQEIQIYTDGGARGNPGPAAIGCVIVQRGIQNVLWEHGEYIGETTNNQAEYRALIRALEQAKTMGARTVQCFLDSELLVKQLNRQYRVKDPTLQPLYLKAYNVAQQFQLITFTHIRRELNKHADRLVNEALDKHAGIV